MVKVLDEAKKFYFGNLTSKILGVAKETHRLVKY